MKKVFGLIAIFGLVFSLIGSFSRSSAQESYTGPITEIAVRQLNQGQDIQAFEQARDSFVTLLKQQEGVSADREFASFLDFATFGAPEPAVFIGMTQYENLEAFMAAGEALGKSEEAGAFFATFNPKAFTALRPLSSDDTYDLTAIASKAGQVLEVAVRDFSSYENFDQADYAAKRDAFLAELIQQEGVVAEYQWISVLDPNIAVGMTVYESAEAFQRVASSAFAQSEVAAMFAGAYPTVAGFASLDAR